MMTDKVIKNMLDKFDDLSMKYYNLRSDSDKVTPELTQALIDYMLFRDTYIQLTSIVWLNSLVSSEDSWMLGCYEAYRTTQLKIFNNGDSINLNDKEFVYKIREWRRSFDDE